MLWMINYAHVQRDTPLYICCAKHTMDSNTKGNVIFEVFTMVKMWIVVFWVVMPCSIVGDYQRFS
jgi:hypothetical protein